LAELPFHPGKVLALLRERAKRRVPAAPIDERIRAAGESRQ